MHKRKLREGFSHQIYLFTPTIQIDDLEVEVSFFPFYYNLGVSIDNQRVNSIISSKEKDPRKAKKLFSCVTPNIASHPQIKMMLIV